MKKLAVLGLFLIIGSVVFAKVGLSKGVGKEELLGEYSFGGYSPIKDLKIEATSNGMIGKTETGESPLEATTKKDTYNLTNYEATLVFKRNSEGKVIGASLTVQGATFEGTKK